MNLLMRLRMKGMASTWFAVGRCAGLTCNMAATNARSSLEYCGGNGGYCPALIYT